MKVIIMKNKTWLLWSACQQFDYHYGILYNAILITNIQAIFTELNSYFDFKLDAKVTKCAVPCQVVLNKVHASHASESYVLIKRPRVADLEPSHA